MINLIKAYFLVLSLTTFNLFAGTIDPLTEDSKYVDYGTKFEFVLNICGMYEEELFCASAVAINPEWILTAAHVVKNAKVCGVHCEDSKVILVDDIIIHDKFDNSKLEGDISLCHLVTNLNLKSYPHLYEKDDEIGKICSISGYGTTGTFLSGDDHSDGKKRAGKNRIDTMYGDLLICSPSKTLTEGRTELEFLIASGDSGGGLFIDNKLAGINSCVLAEKRIPKSKYGDESGHTRISKYIEWIKQTISSRKK